MAPAPPSEQCSCDDTTACSCDEPDPIVVKTPARRKPSATNTPTPAKRKLSTTPIEPRTPVTARKVTATTPARRPAQNVRTPNSAPARAKAGAKKGEPTLFGDFLLGRPTPARQKAARRRSLDAVKAEMREGNMRTVQAPGKVQERVKQWQKNGAAVASADPNSDEVVVTYETESDDGPNEEDRLRVKNRGKRKSKSPIPEQRTGRRTAQDGVQSSPAGGQVSGDERARSKSTAPKRRVISDSHWMKNRKSPPRRSSGIPKNFLQNTATNPPVERKIEDWVRRTTETVEIPEKIETPRRRPRKADRETSTDPPPIRKASKSPYDDGIRVRGSRSASRDDGIRIKPSKDRPAEDSSWVTSSLGDSNDDGIRIKPSKPHDDDGIRVKPTKATLYDDGIRVRPSRDSSVHEDVQIKQIRKDGSKRRPREDHQSPTPTPRRKSETHLRPPTESEARPRVSSYVSSKLEDDGDKLSWTSPSPQENSRRKSRKSDTMTATESLAEIPFGNSAFSVLDLPVGAEAGTLKRHTPKRNPSFGVPRVLKKVYEEGKKIMNDNQEPARGGLNQPPSIDSWLKGTSDPFMDGSVQAETPPQLSPPRLSDYEEKDRTKADYSSENQRGRGVSPKPRTSKTADNEDEEELTDSPALRTRDTLPSMKNSPPVSPGGLKRSPALHKASSPKSGRRLFSKEAIFDAFKGESAMARKKDASPSPFDFIGFGERELNSSPPENPYRDEFEPEMPEPLRNTSAVEAERRASRGPTKNPLASFPRRLAPMTGGNRLSTIASVETFNTSSSVTESELSQTTVTQDTLLNAPIIPSLSRNTVKPRRKRSSAKALEKSKVGSKRGLTKHSDLISMLSLPDTTQPGRSNSIRPARSVRTTRVHLETASVQDLMREIVEDETKYVRELNTLVDGVIPVLLTCVLSKSDVATAAGLFSPLTSSSTNESLTKPIVDMGVALERLKSLHKRIPLVDSNAFLQWALSAHKTYRDYLVAWRTGFQDVVVNLEPASPSASPTKSDTEMKLDKHGDVVRDDGERADVAYLLKRPLVRVKFLARAVKGLDLIKKTKLTEEIKDKWAELELLARSRAKKEAGRREDLNAAVTDATRARDPKTMAPIEGIKIDPTLQVIAKDTFSLDLQHSSGQRMECQTEIILRNSIDRSTGDILICAFDNTHRYLLFPPINKNRVSSRTGESSQQLVIMIRSANEKNGWQEILVLTTDDDEATDFWLKELGTVPLVPALPVVSVSDHVRISSDPTSQNKQLAITAMLPVADDVPIGSRRHEDEILPTQQRSPSYRRRGPVTNAYDHLGEEKLSAITEYNVIDFKHLNETLTTAGFTAVKKLKPRGPSPTKRVTPARYHKQANSREELVVIDVTRDIRFVVEMSGALNPFPGELVQQEQEPKEAIADHRAGSPDSNLYGSLDLPYIPKKRASSVSSISDNHSTPLRESMRPQFQSPKKRQPEAVANSDSPPPVPAHRTSSTPESLKKIPIIDSPTPRNKHRRGSSPLKHEYQPSESDASGTSSCEDSDSSTESDSSGSYSDSSDDELEAIDEEEVSMPASLPPVKPFGKRSSPEGSMYSLGNDSLAPSNSASQGPYRARVPSNGTIVDPLSGDTQKYAATVSFWNPGKGKWEDIFGGPETCSIHVGPGLVQAFEIDVGHSSPNRSLESQDGKDRPLVALGLTPIVPLRKSTMIDIEITSPPLISSRLKNGPTVRFRTINERDCVALYQALHRARLDNPAWKKLEMDRTLAAYGNHAYENAVAPSRRSWFGRKKSYRASVRASSEVVSEQSERSSPSALSALKRLGSGGLFNIAKSSIHEKRGGGSNPSSGPTSMYTTESSEYSGATSPPSPSVAASGSMYSNGLAVRNIGTENLKIRLYRGATNSRWQDMGEALLTVSVPPPGMRHASSLNNGVSKRIVVVKARAEDEEQDESDPGRASRKKGKDTVIWLDVVLGSRNFMRCGRNGIAFEIWEDIRGDDGMLGGVPAIGGVSGRTRKWMFQTQRGGDCVWIYGLVGGQ